MSVEGYIGYWGSGKTVAMVSRILKEQRRCPDIVVGNNFGLRGRNVVPLATMDEMLGFACTDFGRPKILAIDEIGGFLRARGYSAWPPAADIVFQQGRKLMLQVLWTTQHWRFLDVNVRRVTEVVTECRGYLFKRVTPKGVYPIIRRPRLMRHRVFVAPNPEAGELPKECSRARWHFWNQKAADSYDSMRLIQVAADQLRQQQDLARQQTAILEALGLFGLVGDTSSESAIESLDSRL